MSKRKSIVVLTIIAILIILGTVFAFVSLDQGQLGIYDYIAYPKAISLGLDLKGGVFAVFEAKEDESGELTTRLEGTAISLQQLLFDKGYPEAVVALQSGNRIRVEVPDVEDPEQIFNLIGRPASLEFKDDDGNVLVEGSDLDSAFVTSDSNGNPAIGLTFNAVGTKKFSDATSANIGKPLHIYINDELIMSPTVNNTIANGNAIIEGNYTYESAYDMAVQIQAGAFDVTLTIIESRTIGPTLGENALKTSLIAGAISLAFIFCFLILLYKLSGVAACIALSFYILNILFFFAVFPWVQLTLSGIAGIIVGMGMAVDANIIIFERTKDEYRMGKNIRAASSVGFQKSFSAIIDGNVTTIIGVVIIWILGAPTIKGFAITLFIGIILSLITALIVTRLILNSFFAFKLSDKAYGFTKELEGVEDNE